ncbi:MAG: NAD(P)/FAD-dependent oxidoreductase [Candidatus Omnitrophota bacterium]
MAEHYDYDAIIIGAGISGLVCGCYLAKAGLKTLIVEKNAKVGGYCASFTRQGYSFDACAHALGSLREGGQLDKILFDLELRDRLKILRYEPSYIIITPNLSIKIHGLLDDTIKEFQRHFPKEKKQIEELFSFIALSDIPALSRFRSKTFQQLLDIYFKDNQLKTILGLLVLGFVGLPPNQASSVVGCLIIREFVFDGGYYPLKKMQALPDILAQRLVELKGEIKTAKTVKKVIIQDGKARGVTLNDGKRILSRYIISACDVRKLFLEMIDEENIHLHFRQKITGKQPSPSSFLVYLGIRSEEQISSQLQSDKNIILLNKLDIDDLYSSMISHESQFLLLTSHISTDKSLQSYKNISVCLETNTLYVNDKFWTKGKIDMFADRLIALGELIIPNLSKYASLKLTASPVSLNKWTNNYQGASYGWASTIEQFCNPFASQKTEIENLYLTGHWSNRSSGIAFVANHGYDIANSILYKEKRK